MGHRFYWPELGRFLQQETVAGWTRYFTYDDNDKLTKIGTTQGGNDLATFGYDGAGNMTSVSGTMFGSWTLSYDDESRLTSVTYPGGTDSFSYNALGQKMRAVLGGTAYRYVYNGDRVMEETNDAGTVTTRYMTESGSYYSPLINQFRTGCRCRWPLEDGAGTVRGLAANIGGEMSDWYELDAFGVELSSSGASRNDYRFGGAWGYMTDPSGLLQLGHRFYWPEIGRFIQQDPIGDGMNWYAYVGSNPVVWVDPSGLLIWSDVENAVNTVGSALDALGDAVVGAVSNAIMGAFWPQGQSSCPASDDGLGDIRSQLGRGEGFDAREASENLLVKPWVAVGFAKAGGRIGHIAGKWAKRGMKMPKGAVPAGIRNKPLAVRVGDLIYNPHQHPGKGWHADVYNIHKPQVHWQDWSLGQ